jgi:hypothetical protein
MLQRSGAFGLAAGCGLLRGLKFGEIFLAITSSACAIRESRARSLFAAMFVMAPRFYRITNREMIRSRSARRGERSSQELNMCGLAGRPLENIGSQTDGRLT